METRVSLRAGYNVAQHNGKRNAVVDKPFDRRDVASREHQNRINSLAESASVRLNSLFARKSTRMILYKYVSFDDGCAILNGKMIGFSNPWDFNDPFEMSASHAILPNSAFAPFVLKSMMERSAVLSLTRSPLNPLMWAHYAQNHSGFVIGWDANAAGFTDETQNMIPAQHGNVIYTATRPMHPELGKTAPMNYGQEYAFRPELFETLQRYFLYKAMCWSYEEEVRIVKCVFGDDLQTIPSGPIQKIGVNDRPLFLACFPAEAIKEIYVGVCNRLVDHENTATVLQPWKETAQLFECRLALDSWELSTVEYAC